MFTLIRLFLSSRAALNAENLFLQKQLVLFQKRKTKRLRTTPATRLVMVALARFFDWRCARVIVKPEMFIKWHRTAFRILWRWKSRRRCRPPLPRNLRELIRAMDQDNPTWGAERIANELLVKLGIRVSLRTIRKYLDTDRPCRGANHRSSTFVRYHAQWIVACDFCVSMTASFRVLYMFAAMEIGWRRILDCNVTEHPTAEWMMQQFREFLAFDHPYRFVVHDRDSICLLRLDQELKGFGIRVLKTPVRAPQANAFSDGLVRVRIIIREIAKHYSRGGPRSSLRAGIPEPSQDSVAAGTHRQVLPGRLPCQVGGSFPWTTSRILLGEGGRLSARPKLLRTTSS